MGDGIALYRSLSSRGKQRLVRAPALPGYMRESWPTAMRMQACPADAMCKMDARRSPEPILLSALPPRAATCVLAFVGRSGEGETVKQACVGWSNLPGSGCLGFWALQMDAAIIHKCIGAHDETWDLSDSGEQWRRFSFSGDTRGNCAACFWFAQAIGGCRRCKLRLFHQSHAGSRSKVCLAVASCYDIALAGRFGRSEIVWPSVLPIVQRQIKTAK